MMIEKACEVYFRRDGIYVVSSSETTKGYWIASAPMSKFAPAVSPSELGNAVIEALQASCRGVPIPKDHNEVMKKILKFVGYRSWKAFTDGARCVSIEYADNEVTIIPTFNVEDSGGAFNFMPGKAIKSELRAETIGKVLFEMHKTGEE
jgi:hypothetical protein